MKVLIVGYGFAGSSLSYFLSHKGIQVEVISNSQFDKSSSSTISAGIMLPFSGKRKTLSYNVAKALPFALTHYREIENCSNLKILYDLPVRQLITEARDYNDWFGKSNETESAPFIDQINLSIISKSLKNHMGYLQFNCANAVHSSDLLKASNTLSPKLVIKDLQFDIERLEFNQKFVNYKGHSYDYIIFCEGYRTVNNTFWNCLPFMPVKGEIIDIYSPALQLEYILNGSLYIIPMGKDKYKVGATYNWKDLNEMPSLEGINYMKSELEKMISVEYEITNHHAGVRPAIQDRRPVIGFHPVFNRIGIFNGLGTKGAMLSPFYANMLSDHILDNKPIDFEVSVERFAKNFNQQPQ